MNVFQNGDAIIKLKITLANMITRFLPPATQILKVVIGAIAEREATLGGEMGRMGRTQCLCWQLWHGINFTTKKNLRGGRPYGVG